MKILLQWLISSVALLAVPYIVPGVHVANFYTALIAAVVIALINLTLRPILIILTLPVTILTLGLFTLVINAWMFWFVSSFIKGFTVAGFWPALFGSLVFWMISLIGNSLAGVKE
jgi:putative membrane protein